MKRFVWVLGILVIGLIAAIAIHHAPGYVLLQYGTYTVAAPLWLAVLFVFILIVVIYLIRHGVAWLFDLPDRFRHFRRKRRLNQQQQLLSIALNAFLTRDWVGAQSHFAKLAAKGFLPIHSLLLAAEAAKAHNQHDRKRDYLHQANRINADKITTQIRQMHQFDQLLEEGETDAAAKLLPNLVSQTKKKVIQPRQLLLALAQQDWQTAQQFMAYANEQQQQSIYDGLLQKAATGSLEALRKAWRDLPRQAQEHPNLVCTYMALLHQHHDSAHAYQVAHAFLNQHWSDEVFVQYAENNQDVSALDAAEKWLKDQPQTAENQYALALLQQQQQLHERAKFTLQNSLTLQPTYRAAYQLLHVALLLQDRALQQKADKILREKT